MAKLKAPANRLKRSGDVIPASPSQRRSYRLAAIGGDGIGPEVLAQALLCIDDLAALFGFEVNTSVFELGAEHYLRTGELVTDEVLAELARHDAILIGAVGDPRVEPGVLERGLILRIRTEFTQSVNVRPAQLFHGIDSVVKDMSPERCDLVIVRENTEGLYASGGFFSHEGTPWATAMQLSLNTKPAISATVEFAFQLAQQRRKHLTLCHKTNILIEAGRLWSETVNEIGERYPDVRHDYVHADACSVHLLERPEIFDVIVTDNLFGDLLSDLAAVIQGGMGLAPSANLNLTGSGPSMFEPIHGSAPDIAGTGGANPAGAIFAAAMCLSHLGEREAARALEMATIRVLQGLPAMRGPKMGCTTNAVGERIRGEIAKQARDGVAAVHEAAPGTFRSRTDLSVGRG
ncbi:MAG TPA: 3-isopropylmalate dehydrogenase [Acidimicrobiales bacterium]|nr:3-isopropylmalate dehydrogenase [Acidimicrobiales bacterium]